MFILNNDNIFMVLVLVNYNNPAVNNLAFLHLKNIINKVT